MFAVSCEALTDLEGDGTEENQVDAVLNFDEICAPSCRSTIKLIYEGEQEQDWTGTLGFELEEGVEWIEDYYDSRESMTGDAQPTLCITFKENTSSSVRTATCTINSETNPRTISIKQSGTSEYAGVEVSVDNFELTSELERSNSWILTGSMSSDGDTSYVNISNAINEQQQNRSITLLDSEVIPSNFIEGNEYVQYLVAPCAVAIQTIRACPALEELLAPKTKVISADAFYDCASIEELYFPLAIYVGSDAFSYCPSLRSLTIASDASIDASIVFLGDDFVDSPLSIDLVITEDLVNGSYLTTQRSVGVDSGIVGPFKTINGEVKLVSGPFTLTTIPADGRYIEGDDWVIEYNSEVMTVDVSNLISALNTAAKPLDSDVDEFGESTNLDAYDRRISLTLDGFTWMPSGLKSSVDIDNLEELIMPQVASITSGCFQVCPDLKVVSAAECTMASSETFKGCEGIESISLPSLEIVNESCFSGCKSLVSCNVAGASEIGLSAFYSCNALEDVTMDNVSSISTSAFYKCSSLATIYAPKATAVSSRAFSSCSSLTTLTLGTEGVAEVSSLLSDAFTDADVTKIDLTIADNGNYVSGLALLTDSSSGFTFNRFYIGDFKSINGVTAADKVSEDTEMTLATMPMAASLIEGDTWIITDTQAATGVYSEVDGDDDGDFARLFVALQTSNRNITVSFPNIVSFPEYALYNSKELGSSLQTDYCYTNHLVTLGGTRGPEYLYKVIAPKAEEIGTRAFSSSGISYVDMPNVVTIGTQAFYSTDVSVDTDTFPSYAN